MTDEEIALSIGLSSGLLTWFITGSLIEAVGLGTGLGFAYELYVKARDNPPKDRELPEFGLGPQLRR